MLRSMGNVASQPLSATIPSAEISAPASVVPEILWKTASFVRWLMIAKPTIESSFVTDVTPV